jgi:hypothetical protein
MTSNTPRGPLGDARPTASDTNVQASGSTKQEQVEDRDNVSRVTPEDYPHQDRIDGDTSVNKGTDRKEGGGSEPLSRGEGPQSGTGAPKAGGR